MGQRQAGGGMKPEHATESALALAGILESHARKIRAGSNPVDAAEALIPVLIVAARRA